MCGGVVGDRAHVDDGGPLIPQVDDAFDGQLLKNRECAVHVGTEPVHLAQPQEVRRVGAGRVDDRAHEGVLVGSEQRIGAALVTDARPASAAVGSGAE